MARIRRNTMRWLEGLEEPFLAIASTDDSPLRVVAGPGTGKTFAMMRRVMRLLEEHITTPRRILVCTFTRTGAADLARELSHLGVIGISRIWAGTLHAYCFQLLSRAEVLESTDRVPRPLLDFEIRFMMEDFKKGGLGGIRICSKKIDAFNSAWARLQSEEPGWPRDTEDRRFHRALINWLRFHRCMMIGELVPLALQYLKDNPESPERNRFDHVIVDEYQDLNRAEQSILDFLAENGKLTIVGDEDQSIYSFKFAHPEGIVEFDSNHPGTHDEDLCECKRCPRLIVNMANSLIENNMSRSHRILRCCDDNEDGEVSIVQWRDIECEAEGITKFVHRRIQRGDVDPGRVLILSPRRQLGYRVRDYLNQLGIPAHSFFNEEAFDGQPQDLGDSKSQQAFTLLTILAKPDDIVALRCWCGFGSSSLAAGSWDKLRGYCSRNGRSPYEVLDQLVAGQLNIPDSRYLLSRYRDLQNQLAAMNGLSGQDLIDALFPEDESWAATFRLVSPLNDDGDEKSPGELLDALQTLIIRPELPTDVQYVRIMSLHKSKGLTADMVVVLGCIQGMIPSAIPKNIGASDRQRFIEEQRRLFFVAITRTRKTLVLSNFSRLPRDLAYKMRVPFRSGTAMEAYTIASQFMSELGASRPDTLRGTDFLESEGISE